MIFASPQNKEFAARSIAPDTEAASPIEKTLREAAAWEPHCPPPADFAAFTRRALENRARKPFPPANSRPVPTAHWVRGLRAPLAASLALGLVLWVGGSVNDLNDGSVPDQTRETARPVLNEKTAVPSHASPTVKKSDLLVQATEKAPPAARQEASIASDTVQASRSRVALTSHGATVRRHKSCGVGHAEMMLAAHNAKQTPPAPLWKTETVERPAWGALIPATFACSAPASSEPGQESDETETTLMPVVLDVALPENANRVATMSNGAPSTSLTAP